MALKQAFSPTDGVTDLLYVATHLNLCCADIPAAFDIDYDVEVPVEVFSPEVVFGSESDYEFKDFFLKYYDLTEKTWTDNESAPVSGEIKAAVLIQQEDYDLYLSQLAEWNLEYNSQRLVEYRKYMAQKLIDVCA